MASQAVLKRLDRIGQGAISAEQGMLALGASLRAVHAVPQIAVNAFSWDTYLAPWTGPEQARGPVPTMYAEFEASAPPALVAPIGAAAGGRRKRGVDANKGGAGTAAPDAAALRAQVAATVAAAAAEVVGPGVGEDEPLMAAGLDSLGSVEFANMLSQRLGMSMPGTLIFDYPSLRAVGDYLSTALLKKQGAGGDGAAPMPEVDEDGDVPSDSDGEASDGEAPSRGLRARPAASPAARPIALVAMVSQGLQGDILHASPGTQAIVALQDAVHKVPLSRWDLDRAELASGDPYTLSPQVGAGLWCWRLGR